MVSNLFGTLEQARFLFRDTWDRVRRMIELKIDPLQLLRRPTRYLAAPWIGLTMLPRRCSRGPVLAHETTIGQLPQLKSWPDDGGAFVTLPQVYTEDVEQPGLMKSNLGMYRDATVRRPLRAGPGNRPALPDPPRDRRPSRGGPSPGPNRSA